MARADFLREPVFRWWALAATLVRLPGNMAPLGLVLVLPGRDGALAAAGFTAGVATGAAWRGRAIDRAGYRKGLVREAMLVATASAALAAAIGLGAPLAIVLPLSLATGVAGSAVGIAYRAALAAFVPPQARDTAYSVDATMTEASFVVSPVLAAGLVALTPPFALFAVAAALAAAAAATGRALPRDGARRSEGPGPTRTWLRAAAPVYVLTAVVGTTYGLLVAGLPERLADLGWPRTSAGLLFSLMSGASMVAGALVAARGGLPAGRRSPVAALLAVFAVATALIAITTDPRVAVVAMALYGIPLAPLSVIGTAALCSRVPETSHAQALAMFAGTVTATMGVGLALAAVALELAGPAVTIGASAAGTAVGALLTAAALGRRRRRVAR